MAKSFLSGAQFFKLCPIVFNYAQHIFSGGVKSFVGEASPPFPPDYGPVSNSFKYVQHIFPGGPKSFQLVTGLVLLHSAAYIG